MRAKRTAQSIVAKLIPRDAIHYADDRAVIGKLVCYDIDSQSEPGKTYRASFTHISGKFWCECPGFAGHGHCKHADSLAYYVKVDQARRCYAHWDDDRLIEEQDSLLAVHADLALDWPGLAELDALGDELLARMTRRAA